METTHYPLKHGVALVLRGPQGCGKRRLALNIAAAYGSVAELDTQALFSRKSLNNVIHGAPDTLIIHGFFQEKLEEIKAMISSEKMVFEKPHGQQKVVKTPNFIFLSGNSNPIGIEKNDRRFFVVDLFQTSERKA